MKKILAGLALVATLTLTACTVQVAPHNAAPVTTQDPVVQADPTTDALTTDQQFLNTLQATEDSNGWNAPETDEQMVNSAKGMCLELGDGTKTPSQLVMDAVQASMTDDNPNEAKWWGGFFTVATTFYCPDQTQPINDAIATLAGS
jgi:hypothetical protein